jgi:hypothetical protein
VTREAKLTKSDAEAGTNGGEQREVVVGAKAK